MMKLTRAIPAAALFSAILLNAACGGSPGDGVTDPPEVNEASSSRPAGVVTPPPAAQDGQGQPSPAAGQSRAGTIYDVTIPSPLGDDQSIAATIFEPAQMTGGETYPLVLYASGFGGVRETGLVSSDPQAVAFKQLVDLTQLIQNGYGVLSFDHLGHGETTGQIRVMDPDYEGANVIRVVDWAEANLDWLAYGPSVDGSDPDNLILGSVSASYGGGYQLMLNAIDPKRRLDAIVPLLTWNDLPYSLAQGDVIKDGWVRTLADGKDDVFDPFFLQQLALLFETNELNDEIVDTLRYHSPEYWCGQRSVTHNAGVTPLRPSQLPPAVPALFVQSSRDILFNFSEAYRNYQCYAALGEDTRLYSVQIGHNTIGTLSTFGLTQAPGDPGAQYQVGDTAMLSATCAGEGVMTSTLKFFDEYLKGNAGASQEDNPICLDLAANDSILVDAVQVGGDSYAIEPGLTNANLVIVGQDDSGTVTTVPLFTAGATGNILAGIPVLDVTLADEADASNADATDTIIFAAIGHRRLTGLGAGVWDIVDNQLTPLRGLGSHQIEMVGVLERLRVGDELGLMLFGANLNQYRETGSQAGTDFATQVRVTGTVELPILDTVPPALRTN